MIARDAVGDGSIDVLVCSFDKSNGIPCQLSDHASGTWQTAVRFNGYPTDESAGDIKRALKTGEITPVSKRWPDIKAAN